MKITLLLVILISLTIQAQKIQEYHVGGLYNLYFSPESQWERQESYNFRAAVEVLSPTWRALNISVKGRLILTTPLEKSGGQLWLSHSNYLGDFSAGKISRPITLIRPSPASCGAGFEPAAKAIIPGSTLGISYTRVLAIFSVQAGLYQSANEAEYNLGLFLQKINLRIGGYYSQRQYGAAVGTENELFAFSAYGSKSMLSSFIEVNYGLFKPYIDVVYDHKEKKWLNQEIGLTKEFAAITVEGLKELKWLLGVGYNRTSKKISFYSYLHL